MTDILPVPEPPHTADLDKDLVALVRRTRRVQAVSLIALGLILISAILVGGKILVGQQDQVTGSCQFFRDLTSLPVTPIPPLKRPTRLSVILITHARSAYIGLGCQPEIPPPHPSLLFWARQYHINVP